MIPRISHLIEHDCAPLFVTTDGVVGAIGQIRIIDSEMSGAFEQQDRIRRWLKAVSPSLTMRFIREIKNGSITDGMSERISAVENIGFLTQEIYLSIECRGSIQAIKEIKTFLGLKHSSLDNQVLEVVGAIDQLRQNGANFTFLKSNEVEKQFFWSRYPGFRVCASHLETGLEKVGCFRLRRQAPEDISVFELGHSFERLSSPVSISTSVKRIEPVRREMMLRTRLKQDQSSDDAISKSKADSTGEALQSSFLEGAELFEFELVGIVTARTEDVLKERLLNCKEAFSPLGDIQIETFGCLPTLTASFVGSPQHVPLLEMDQGLMAFLPVVANGESVDVRELQKRDLLLARKDRSLAQVDLLGKSHGNANALIIGHSGKGKSVFTGLLTTSLLNDPSTRVIKVDVGGSHSRECELLGGQEFAMSLNSPSGLNPFSIMDCGNSDENARAILGKFIEVLVTEDGEDIPPKIVRVEIDDLLKRYLAQSPKEASLGTFYDSCADFSRVAL